MNKISQKALRKISQRVTLLAVYVWGVSLAGLLFYPRLSSMYQDWALLSIGVSVVFSLVGWWFVHSLRKYGRFPVNRYYDSRIISNSLFAGIFIMPLVPPLIFGGTLGTILLIIDAILILAISIAYWPHSYN